MNKNVAPQRKNFLINKKFQFKYIALITGTLLLMVLLIEFDIYSTMKTILPKVLFTEEIRKDITAFNILLTIKSFVFIAIVAFMSIYFSHRITGPIYRLEKDLLLLISEGDLTKQFRLREKDELKEIAAALNAMITNFRTRLLVGEQFHEEAREQLTEVLKLLKEKETITSEDKNSIIKKVDSLLNYSMVSPVSFKI
jgi:methyl-accepting chemotaxis protein